MIQDGIFNVTRRRKNKKTPLSAKGVFLLVPGMIGCMAARKIAFPEYYAG
jgi:hypothetical protein